MTHYRQQIVLALALMVANFSIAQTGSWMPVNEGISSGGSDPFEVAGIFSMKNGDVLALIERHTEGQEKNGIYRLNQDSWSWTRIGPQANGYGFAATVSDGENIIDIREGAVRKFFPSDSTWQTIANLPDYGLEANRGIDILDGVLYVPCRIENGDLNRFSTEIQSEFNFVEREEFVMTYDILTGEISLLRNKEKPLIISSKGGNPKQPIALTSGKVYHYSTFDYKSKDGWGGLYEWNGNEWKSASAGLNAINITGSGFGPIGPIYTDTEHQKLYIRTEQGFYSKDQNGWYKYFYRTPSSFYITPDYLFTSSWNGSFTKIDRAVKIDYTDGGDECISFVRNFMTHDNGTFFLAEMASYIDEEGNCQRSSNKSERKGIYRYVPDEESKGKVQNLHLDLASYIGGAGEKEIADVVINNQQQIVVAGNFRETSANNHRNLLNSTSTSIGKLMIFSPDGTILLETINLGEEVYDVDYSTNRNEIAVSGSFGVVVLSSDLSLKWHQDIATPSRSNTSHRPRVAIGAQGEVVVTAYVDERPAVLLFDADGSPLHTNFALDNEAKKILDIEIDSDRNQYYVSGFKQVNSILQVAYLQAYPIAQNTGRIWKTWGFENNDISTSDNGADTRAYLVKLGPDGYIYVAGESAGGGPGGFSMFAYNGKDLSTKVAHRGNDFFTDGTNSGGAGHITFVCRIDPTDGVVQRGKFFHARLSNGKTNTHRVRNGDIEIDEQGHVFITGVSAAQFQDRDVFNVNGNLIERYSGGDQYILMTSNDFNTRHLWGAFPKSHRGGGTDTRLAVKNGRVVYLAKNTRGQLMTTQDSPQPTPYNWQGDSLSAADTYLATWATDVWNTANNDSIQYPFIEADSCFRVDGKSCYSTEVVNLETDLFFWPNPAGDFLTVRTPDPGVVRFYDRAGKLVQETEIDQAGNINVSGLKHGLYIIHLQTGKRNQYGRLLKE